MELEDCQYRVDVPLRTTYIYDIEARVNEVRDIVDWVDEQVGWQKDQYEVNIRVSSAKIVFWFKDEQIAMLTALRWI